MVGILGLVLLRTYEELVVVELRGILPEMSEI
jgi:hypothetical protein